MNSSASRSLFMIEKIILAGSAYNCKFKIRLKDSSAEPKWEKCIIRRTHDFFETESLGLFTRDQVDYIEIDTLSEQKSGRLVSAQIINHKEKIKEELYKEGILFSEFVNIIRIRI